MNIFVPDRVEFIRGFLKPISNFNELGKLEFGEDISCIVSNVDATCILYAKYNSSNPGGPKPIAINVRKLINSLECIDDDEARFTLEDNTVLYKSRGVRFKLHTLNLSVVANLPINKDKINQLEATSTFFITPLEVRRLIKSSTFVEANKLYLQYVDGSVYVTLTDKSIDNTDSFALKLESEPSSEFQTTPINFEIIRQLASLPIDSDSSFQINMTTVKAVEIFIRSGNYQLKYILSPYQK